MYNLFLHESEFDFVLTDDTIIYDRNYSDYEAFNIDVTASLSSISGISLDDSVTLNNIILTGYDNFLIPDINITGHTITSGSTFTLHAVSGYSGNIIYDILTGSTFNQLNGGFYQGFFKLYSYPVEYFKVRATKGWTVNMLITNPMSSGTTTGDTLNTLHPENNGFIFYLGTRAENKYYTVTGSAIDNLSTILGIPESGITTPVYTGETIGRINDDLSNGLITQENLYTNEDIFTLSGTTYSGFYNVKDGVYYTGRTYDGTGQLVKSDLKRYDDIINNAFGVFITEDGHIGYKNIYKTDRCDSGTTDNPIQDASTITNNSFIDITTDCDINKIEEIKTKYFTIRKVTTKNSVISIDTDRRFLNVTVVFNRDFEYGNNCLLEYGKHKIGKLQIYINGILIFKDNNFTEVIPHILDTNYFYQEGVPFNISFGGGSQGLLDSVDVLDDYNNPYNHPIIDEFFSGTYIGGVRLIKMYMTPLYATEIKKEVNNIKNTYNLYVLQGGRRVLLKNLY